MKKIIFLVLIISFLACSEEDNLSKAYINIQLDEIPEAYKDNYNFTDLNIAIYANKNDYLNETNVLFSGKFDSNGKISLSENIERSTYYVDIFTNDFALSNWQYIDLDLTSTNIIAFYASEVSSFFNRVTLTDNRSFVGEWNFTGYNNHYNHDPHDRSERTKLVIRKDFSVTSYETHNNTEFTIEYIATRTSEGIIDLKYISTLPSENGYPYFDVTATSGGLRNPDGISLNIVPNSNNKIIELIDYADEWARYSK